MRGIRSKTGVRKLCVSGRGAGYQSGRMRIASSRQDLQASEAVCPEWDILDSIVVHEFCPFSQLLLTKSHSFEINCSCIAFGYAHSSYPVQNCCHMYAKLKNEQSMKPCAHSCNSCTVVKSLSSQKRNNTTQRLRRPD